MNGKVLDVNAHDTSKEVETPLGAPDTQQLKKIVIVGLPNTGKSQIFNNLTGEYSIVANYPLTTVEIKRTQCRIGDRECTVFDTPGLHSLYIHSEEELIVRDMIFAENPDIIIQCIDANRLKQSLILTADLLELQVPLVVSLNAIDETSKKGIWIDSDQLSNLLGVPVVESNAINGQGTKELKDAINKARKGIWHITYGQEIEDGIEVIEAILPKSMYHKRKIAVLSLLSDHFLLNHLKAMQKENQVPDISTEVEKVKRLFKGKVNRVINHRRNLWIEKVKGKIVKKQKLKQGELSQIIARLCRHPIWGFPILLFFLFATFQLVVHVAGYLDGFLSAIMLDPIINLISDIVPSGFWQDFIVGPYGVLTLGLFNAIVTVLPILSVFFLMFALLEDIGYIPNLCVLTKRIFEKIGLTGNAILPLTLGFGCKTMATMATKSLVSKKEKYIAIYLIAFAIPCSAQLGINMGILGKVGLPAFIIAFSVMIFVELIAGYTLNKIIKEDENKNYFIQELPPIRFPSVKAIFVKTYYRLFWFLKEALPVFIIAAIIIFFADKLGALSVIKNVLSPVVVKWLGLPVDIVEVLILCVARREAAAGLLITMVDEGLFNYIQCIVAVVITTISFPCFANIAIISKELGIKATVIIISAIMMSSLLFGGVLYRILLVTIGG